MYKYGGYIYNYDGTNIVEDPDCLDYEPADDYDEVTDDYESMDPDEFYGRYILEDDE